MKGIEKFIELAESSDDDNIARRYLNRTLISGQIEDVMEELGVSRSDLAEKLDCSRANISRLLSGDRNLTIDTLSDIATALECDIELKIAPRDSKKIGIDVRSLDWTYHYQNIRKATNLFQIHDGKTRFPSHEDEKYYFSGIA